MKEDFLDLFPNLTINQFNKYQYYEDSDYLHLHSVGLHKLSNTKYKEQHLHSHSHNELHYAIDGYSVYGFGDGSTVRLTRGSWLLIPADYPHKILEYSEPYIKYSCAFSLIPSQLSSINPAYNTLKKLMQSNTILQGVSSDFALQSIHSIYELMAEDPPFTDSIIKNTALNVLLSTLSPLCLNRHPHKDSARKNDARLAIAMRFISDNLSRKLSCEDVARKVYVSPRQLDRIFLKHTSISVAEFIYEKKCEEAKRLLASTHLPIKTISENLGFSDPTYFNRFFKKRVGVPPYQFREAARSQEKNPQETQE